ncbi:unnamed protein product [Adineta steineri]|uniref:Uncharacterized protein n=1 Tax=Adineta steineri TaxID=433720 RepID=A0A819FW48_9BILA|nr:unnamed protein product [Adineta steineri]
MMGSIGMLVLRNSSDTELELYIYYSTIQMIQLVYEKIILITYSIILLISIIQTFWKNKYIDNFFAYINDAYSDGKFVSNQVSVDQQIITCYRFDQRFSLIPNPKRLVLPIITTHIQILLIIAIQTIFIRKTELIEDCLSFYSPYEILQCDDNNDPCQLNNTGYVPKCTYYYFEMSHVITMITSLITWHYGLRYLVIKLVRFIRWIMFRNDDQPRMLCCFCCCFRSKQRIIKCIMYFQYLGLWIYYFLIVFLGFMFNLSITRTTVLTLGSVWMPIILAVDRLLGLIAAIIPELLENWLNISAKLEYLQILNSNHLHLENFEPLIHLINKKTKNSKLTADNKLSNNIKTIIE